MNAAAKESEAYIVYPSGCIGLCVEIREFSGFDSYTYRAAAHGPVRLETLADAFDMQLGLHHEADSYTFMHRVAVRAMRPAAREIGQMLSAYFDRVMQKAIAASCNMS